ncbi:MAG: hypothetical protein HYT48_03605 [Candidatus Vogelbacteria bacterium]|nr:hypothetical protein [Candidatus Vogelbacteria bacterium]
MKIAIFDQSELAEPTEKFENRIQEWLGESPQPKIHHVLQSVNGAYKIITFLYTEE